jgi:restriction system protein
MKPVWVMRAGSHGEDEELALAESRAVIGFRRVRDLVSYPTAESLIEDLLTDDKTANRDRAANWARQVWAFGHTAKDGDTVVLPLKSRPGQIALGTLAGPYEYVTLGGEKRHTRRVNWLRPDVPRSTFEQDLLYSFGAFMTVCRIRRNDAEKRVAAVLAGQPDPGFTEVIKPSDLDRAVDDLPVAQALDIAQAASDEVVAFVRRNFQGHDLARLVGAVLQAEGYVTHVSPPGPDGGADILAGRGPLGLDSPTLCVQVKAMESAVDVKVLRELVGTMDTFKADQGLLVSWGGFTQPLKNEARQKTFKVRLWDQSDVVAAVYRSYDKLPPEIQNELPLKRVWVLVREDTAER